MFLEFIYKRDASFARARFLGAHLARYFAAHYQQPVKVVICVKFN